MFMQEKSSLISNIKSKINKPVSGKKALISIFLIVMLLTSLTLAVADMRRQASVNWKDGWTAWKAGNPEQALSCWTRNSIAPNFARRPARIYYWRIRALDELGRNEEAEELRVKLSKKFPTDFYTFMLSPNGANSYVSKEVLLKKAKLFYPRPWGEEVSRASHTTGLSKKTIWSVMKRESKFLNNVVSKSGAIGLMQLMPITAKNVAKQMGIEDADISTPADNIMIGAGYYSILDKNFNGDLVRVTAAYNAGETVVTKWDTLNSNEWDEWIENIPYPETREFVRSVLENREIYRIIYAHSEYKPLYEVVKSHVTSTSFYTDSSKTN